MTRSARGESSTLPEHRSARDVVRDRNLRRIGLAAAWLLLVAAIVGLLGVRMGSAEVSAGSWTLRVEHPQVTRPALDAPVTIIVVQDGGFEDMVHLRVPRDLLEHLDVNLLSPAPDAETGTGTYVEWTFEPPAADTLVVSIDARLSPSEMVGLDRFDVAVVDDAGAVLVKATVSMIVLP